MKNINHHNRILEGYTHIIQKQQKIRSVNDDNQILEGYHQIYSNYSKKTKQNNESFLSTLFKEIVPHILNFCANFSPIVILLLATIYFYNIFGLWYWMTIICGIALLLILVLNYVDLFIKFGKIFADLELKRKSFIEENSEKTILYAILITMSIAIPPSIVVFVIIANVMPASKQICTLPVETLQGWRSNLGSQVQINIDINELMLKNKVQLQEIGSSNNILTITCQPENQKKQDNKQK